MNNYRVTRQLDTAVAAYIAGLIDGEGTVTLTRHHARENRRLVVSVANTELRLLEFLADQIGTGRITRKRTVCARHTPSYCYCVSSRQALALLQQVAPFMLSYKRKRAEMALASYESLTPRNGKYSQDSLVRRMMFEQEFMAIKPDRAVREPATEYCLKNGLAEESKHAPPRPAIAA
jgi:hypothetical protein